MRRKALCALHLLLSIIFLFACTSQDISLGEPERPPEVSDSESSPEEDRTIGPDGRMDIESYIHAYTLPLYLDGGDLSGLDTEAEDWESYTLFLVGEHHASAANAEIQIFLIKYLSQRYGLRLILMEKGYGETQLLKLYLDTGNEEYLDRYMSICTGTGDFTQENYHLFQELCAYNQTLAEEDRLVLLGIDVEQKSGGGKAFLECLVPYLPPLNEAPEPAAALLAQPLAVDETATRAVLADIDQNEAAYMDYFGDYFFDFRATAVGISQAAAFDQLPLGSAESDNYRESCMLSNFFQIYDHFGVEKYFGQFGSRHTEHNLPNGAARITLTAYLDGEYAETAGKILNFKIIYDESQAADWLDSYAPFDLEDNIYARWMGNNVDGSNYGLLRIDRPETAFRMLNSDYIFEGHRYFILARNSEASQPYGR